MDRSDGAADRFADLLLSTDGGTVDNQSVENVMSLSQGGSGSKKCCNGEGLHGDDGMVKKVVEGVSLGE